MKGKVISIANAIRKSQKGDFEMAKTMKINLGNKKVTINPNNPKVVQAIADFIKAVTTPQLVIGMTLKHENGDKYQLVRIKQSNGTYRAYLINQTGWHSPAGVARNSRKVVLVQEADGGCSDAPRGYVDELPAERDRFYNPDGSGDFLDC